MLKCKCVLPLCKIESWIENHFLSHVLPILLFECFFLYSDFNISFYTFGYAHDGQIVIISDNFSSPVYCFVGGTRSARSFYTETTCEIEPLTTSLWGDSSTHYPKYKHCQTLSDFWSIFRSPDLPSLNKQRFDWGKVNPPAGIFFTRNCVSIIRPSCLEQIAPQSRTCWHLELTGVAWLTDLPNLKTQFSCSQFTATTCWWQGHGEPLRKPDPLFTYQLSFPFNFFIGKSVACL